VGALAESLAVLVEVVALLQGEPGARRGIQYAITASRRSACRPTNNTVFGRFSVRGVQKHHKNIFATKAHVKNFPQKIDKISMSVSPRFFRFYRIFGCFSGWQLKDTTKNVLQKIASKSFNKKIEQKTKDKRFKTVFFLIYLPHYHVFGRFSVRGVQKHHQKNITKKNLALALGPFLASGPPPHTHHHTGSPVFLAAPRLRLRPSVFGALSIVY
jgi:hypothetical protein